MTVTVFCCFHHYMLLPLGKEIMIMLNPWNIIGRVSQCNPCEQLYLLVFKKRFWWGLFCWIFAIRTLPWFFFYIFYFKSCGTISTVSQSLFFFPFFFSPVSRCCTQIAIWPVRSSGICLMVRCTTSWGSKWIARMPFQKCMTKSAKLRGTEPEWSNQAIRERWIYL